MTPEGASPIPAFVVLGPWAGGTTVVARVLHALGVQMGDDFFVCNDPRTGVTFEERSLREILLAYFDEPLLRPRAPVDARLAEWAEWQRREARSRGRVAIAAKHPILSVLVSRLVREWRPVRFIRVRRPYAAVMRSLERRRWWPAPAVDFMHARVHAQLDEDLVGVEHYCIDYDRLCAAPAREIRAMLHGVGLAVSDARIDAAAGCVRLRPTATGPPLPW